MYKLIACDLDETLLNDQKEIGEGNVKAIKRAELEYGVKFVPATGRGYTCIDNVLHTLDVYDKAGEYTISNNGGVITENKGYRELTFHELPFDKAKELFAFGMSKDVCVQIFTAKEVYAFHLNPDEEKWLFTFKPDAIVCEETTLDFLENTPIAKMLFQNVDQQYLRVIEKEMRPLTAGVVSTSFSSNRYLELNHSGVDKGLGLHELANYLGIAIEDTIAIGDNYNDVAMLEEAGLSIAVANANEDIKKICHYITKATNNEDAIAEVLEKYIFHS